MFEFFIVEASNVNSGSSFTLKEDSSSPDPHRTEANAEKGSRLVGSMKDLKPSEIVAFLNQHIVGQLDAKKAVAHALSEFCVVRMDCCSR